ncbi:OmpA family protein [Nocardioides campestrisoli]|uniref:OmpA family protein n=1 Tax=Nocardioides campestrisoli TaxID=2736757 RepID=UPI00163DBE96|nr:OmpA family protein [Nocardioides campestrisoli]
MPDGYRRGPSAAGPVLLALLVAFLAGSCRDGQGGEDRGVVPSPATGEPTVASGTAAPDPACTPRPGRRVETVPDVLVPAVEVPAVVGEDGEVLVPALTIPAQEVDGGCVVHHDAPGGCLGAVEVTGATIPPAVIPGAELDGRVYPEVLVPGASVPGARAPQVCRVERDDQLVGVTRAGVVREGFARDGAARPGDDRVPTVRLAPVRVPDVDVDPERLESRRLREADGVSVLQGSGTTSYVASSGVLFDSDSAALRPESRASLLAMARQIGRSVAGERVLVEGHTDDRGDEAYGMRLSRARASAVADWLVREAGLEADDVTTRGYGETRPAHPNDSEANRARNRRVVITVVGAGR